MPPFTTFFRPTSPLNIFQGSSGSQRASRKWSSNELTALNLSHWSCSSGMHYKMAAIMWGFPAKLGRVPLTSFFSWLSLRTHNRQARHPRAQPPSTNNTSRAFSTFGSQSTRRGTSVAKAPSAGCSIPYHVFNTNIYFFHFHHLTHDDVQ